MSVNSKDGNTSSNSDSAVADHRISFPVFFASQIQRFIVSFWKKT